MRVQIASIMIYCSEFLAHDHQLRCDLNRLMDTKIQEGEFGEAGFDECCQSFCSDEGICLINAIVLRVSLLSCDQFAALRAEGPPAPNKISSQINVGIPISRALNLGK